MGRGGAGGAALKLGDEMCERKGEGGEDHVQEGEQGQEDDDGREQQILAACQQQLPTPPADGVFDTGQLQQLPHPGPPVRVPGHHQLDDSPQLWLEVNSEAGVRASRPQIVPQLAAFRKVHVSGQLQQCDAQTEYVASFGKCPGQNLRRQIHRVSLHA